MTTLCESARMNLGSIVLFKLSNTILYFLCSGIIRIHFQIYWCTSIQNTVGEMLECANFPEQHDLFEASYKLFSSVYLFDELDISVRAH